MGKLFGDSRQAASPSPVPAYGGCRQNCCHGHGYGHGWNSNGSFGDPYQGNAQNMNTHCMGRCNPAKLYSETYNYLTDNLMQPTIKEVYNDLKSLTPENTIANNPMAKQMGLSPNGIAAQGNVNAPNMGNMGNMNAVNMGKINAGNMGSMNAGNIGSINAGNMGSINAGNMGNNFTGQPNNEANSTEVGVMGGMGPQIMNMLGGNMANQTKSNNQHLHVGQSGQLMGQMMTAAPQSPTSQNGVTSLPAQIRNQDVFNAHTQNNYSPSDHNANQSMMQPNMQIQPGGNSPNAGTTYPTSQQMTSGHFHGAHSKGIAKFKEMFPGVVNNMGGDLGFDPMEIAIQMNPANQQQAAMNTMTKMMQNNNLNKVFDPSANPSSGAGKGSHQNQIQNNVPPQSTPAQQAYEPNIQTAYQDSVNNANVYGNSNAQHIYTAGHATTISNQQDIPPEQQYQQQNITDSNTGNTMAPANHSSTYEETPYQKEVFDSSNVQRMIKEPILPADTSRMGYIAPKRQQYFEYNTLGQPIEKCSADVFRTPVPNLPQTLSPQPIPMPMARKNAAKYSNVKSTVSKTSLVGAKPGRTPSQLQLIYNQYKGSQSFTQQNIGAPVNNASHSEGKLNENQIQQPRQMPVEKVGGDSAVNNIVRDERTAKVEQVIGQNGDVPTAAVRATGDGKTDEVGNTGSLIFVSLRFLYVHN